MNAGEYFQKQMVSGSSQTNPKIDSTPKFNRNSIEFWQRILGLQEWSIEVIKISSMQVIDDLHGGTCGHEFVGVAIKAFLKSAEIYCTRRLKEDDIIHELLHVRFPNWEEDMVVKWTDILVETRDYDILTNKVLLLTTT